MRAITVKQPWAWAIQTGAKSVENRTRAHPWQSAVGERIAIHAGKSWDENAFDSGSPMWPLAQAAAADGDGKVPGALLALQMLPQCYPRGAVVATAVLDGVHQARPVEQSCCCRPWGFYSYDDPTADPVWHLVLSGVVRFGSAGPVPCRGALGLWTLPADVEQLVRERSQVAA